MISHDFERRFTCVFPSSYDCQSRPCALALRDLVHLTACDCANHHIGLPGRFLPSRVHVSFAFLALVPVKDTAFRLRTTAFF